MSTNPKISIIVPVYKAEAYLHRCVDSLLAQTFTDFEVLLIDDGSPDNSGEMCDEYAAKDNRVRVFHKENGGVSSARQYGLDNAQGEYLIHADPDDWVEPTMLEELYEKAIQDNADMVICDYYENRHHGQCYKSQRPNRMDAPTVLWQILFQQLHGSCCNKLVRRVCYSQYGLEFPREVSLWEDLYVNCRLLMQDIHISYLDRAFYHYDLHSNAGSIVRTPSLGNIRSQLYVINWFERHLPDTAYAPAIFNMKAAIKEQAFRAQLPPNLSKTYTQKSTPNTSHTEKVYTSVTV